MTAQYYVVSQNGNVGGKGTFRVLDGPHETRDKAQEWVAPMASRMKQIKFENALDIFWVKEYQLDSNEKLSLWKEGDEETVESEPCSFEWPEYNVAALLRKEESNA
jgi:hypothetical protein